MKTKRTIGLFFAAAFLATTLLTMAVLPSSGAKYIASGEAPGELTVVWSKKLVSGESFTVTPGSTDGYYAINVIGGCGGIGSGNAGLGAYLDTAFTTPSGHDDGVCEVIYLGPNDPGSSADFLFNW